MAVTKKIVKAFHRFLKIDFVSDVQGEEDNNMNKKAIIIIHFLKAIKAYEDKATVDIKVKVINNKAFVMNHVLKEISVSKEDNITVKETIT